MALSMFGIGMFLGSYLFKYISLKRVNNFLFFMLADSIFSFILSLNLAKPILIFCYTLQGIFAMFMIIFFKAFTQKLFSDTIEFSLFRNSFIRYTSIATVISYFIAIAISMITNNGSIIFRIMSLCEFLVFIYYYYYIQIFIHHTLPLYFMHIFAYFLIIFRFGRGILLRHGATLKICIFIFLNIFQIFL